MIGWFSPFFSFFFFKAVPWEQQWLTCKVLWLYGKWKIVLQKYTMHCKQWFAVVIQQVRANILAQLGSNPFQPHHGAIADPTTPSMGSQNDRFSKKKNHYVSLCCSKIQRTGSWGQSLSTRSETAGLVSFFPFHILETVVMVLKGNQHS